MDHKRTITVRQRLLAAALSFGLVTAGMPIAFATDSIITDTSGVITPTMEQIEHAQINQKTLVYLDVAYVKSDGTVGYYLSDMRHSMNTGSTAWDMIKVVLDSIRANNGAYEVSTALDGKSEVRLTKLYTTEGDAFINTTTDPNYCWQFIVNGTLMNITMDQYTLMKDDRVTLFYGPVGGYVQPEGVDPDDLSSTWTDVAAEWPTFGYNNNVISAATPTAVSVSWKTLVGGGAAVSEPLLVGGGIYVAVGSSFMGGEVSSEHALQLVRINTSTGEIEASTPLAGEPSYTCRPTYFNGLIYIPLDGGSVQAVNVNNMKTRWVSAATEGQASTSLKVITMPASDGLTAASDGLAVQDVLFSGTAVFGGNAFSSGTLSAIDPASGAVLNTLSFTDEAAGMYWTNVVSAGGYAVTGDTAGTLTTISASAEARKTLNLGAALNADLVTYGDKIVAVTRDGVLHLVSVADDGSMAEVGAVQAVGGSTASATIVGSQAIVAGQDATIAVVNLDTLAVEKTITNVDGEKIAGPLASPVLVSQQNGNNICYVTLNNATDPNESYTSYGAGGNVYWFNLASDTEAHKLWAPDAEQANYCDSPLIAQGDGSLYYINDSGYLVKLSQTVVKPATSGTTQRTTTNSSTTSSSKTTSSTTSKTTSSTTSKTTSSSTSNKESLADTGDNSTSAVAIVAMAVALLGVGFAVRLRKGGSKHNAE